MKEYIEREAVLQVIEYVSDGYEYIEYPVEYAIEKLDAIPAADVVEVRHGRWVWDENGMDWNLGAWKCSECHCKPETWWEADKGNPYRCAGSSYCNNCGAKMDGGVTDAAD